MVRVSLQSTSTVHISNCIRCHQHNRKCTKALRTHSPPCPCATPGGLTLKLLGLHTAFWQWVPLLLCVYKQERRNRRPDSGLREMQDTRAGSCEQLHGCSKDDARTVPTLTLESRQCHSPPQHGLKSRSSAQNTVLLAAVKWSDQKQSTSPKRKGKS